MEFKCPQKYPQLLKELKFKVVCVGAGGWFSG